MTTQTQIRRGTAAQCNLLTPADGEIIYDQTNDRLRIGDGATLGGIPLPNIADIQKGIVLTGNDSGTTNHVVVSLTPDPGTPSAGMTVVVKIANTNTAAADLALNGGAAIAIDKVASGSIVTTAGNELTSGAYQVFRFNGTHWLLETGTGGGISAVNGADGVSASTAAGITTVRLDTNNSGGVGAVAMLRYVGSTLGDGGTASGTLYYVMFEVGVGAAITAPNSQTVAASGTWRNISGRSLGPSGSSIGMFIRVS